MKSFPLLSVVSVVPFVGFALAASCIPETKLGNYTQYQAAGEALCSSSLLNYTDPTTGIYAARTTIDSKADCQEGVIDILYTCIAGYAGGGVATTDDDYCIYLGYALSGPLVCTSPTTTTSPGPPTTSAPASSTGTTSPFTPTPYTTTRTTTTTTVKPSSSATRTAPVPTQTHYGQCGGIGYSGATVCASPYTCKVFNPYYSQCL